MKFCSINAQLVALSLVTLSSVAHGATLVAPNAYANVEASSGSPTPFLPAGTLAANSDSARYQQVFNASEFLSVGQPLLISAIVFRPNPTSPLGLGTTTPTTPFTATIPSFTMSLSTCTAGADGLSTTFASNIGGDVTTVVPSGPLTLSSAVTGAEPKDFDILVSFSTPFLYNPANGNLLMDVTRDGIAVDANNNRVGKSFDAITTSGDSVSRVISAGSVNSGASANPTGSPSTNGLVAQFVYEPVPEPASLLTIGLGLIGVIRLRRSK